MTGSGLELMTKACLATRMAAPATLDIKCGQCITPESSQPPTAADPVSSWGSGPHLVLGSACEPTADEVGGREAAPGLGARLTAGSEVGVLG